MAFDKNRIGWLSGMPRSGTTWLSQIFASSSEAKVKFCPLFSYEFKNALTPESSAEDWHQFFEAVYKTKSAYMDQEHLRKDALVPTFQKSDDADLLLIKSNRFHHLMPDLLSKVDGVKLIYLVRHPAATLHSWLSNPTEFPKSADPLSQWRTGACRKTDVGEFWGFNDWVRVTKQALELERCCPGRVLIQRYEKLSDDPLAESSKLFDFLGITLGEDTRSFISASRSRHDPNKRSVFKTPGPDNRWKTELAPCIIEAINSELRGTELERYIGTE